jgi:protein-S-isoprenylcysteine O-methyltransferase Ste14
MQANTLHPKKKVLLPYGYAQPLFFLALIFYVWTFPPYLFARTWLDTALKVGGLSLMIVGVALRTWAVSHIEKCTKPGRLRAPVLVINGPYAVVRNPIYLGNFFIGLGIVVFAKAVIFIPLFLIFFVVQYRTIVAQEEGFLSEKFGKEFYDYCSLVPKWIPRVKPITRGIGFGPHFPFRELGTALGIVMAALFFQWIESPLHRLWITGVWYWLTD